MKLTAPLAAAIAASVGLALGAQDPAGRQGERSQRPGTPLLIALDADHDGIISAGEMAAAPGALASLDRNADGVISRAEILPMGRGREGRGEGGRDERGRGGEPGNTPPANADDLVATLMAFDANKDAQLTKAELPERMQPIFDRSDVNKDGLLTADEIRKSAQSASRPASGGGGSAERGEGERREGGRGAVGPGGMDLLASALDTNRDGALQAAEVAAAAESLRALDKNKDGRITADEYRPTGRQSDRPTRRPVRPSSRQTERTA